MKKIILLFLFTLYLFANSDLIEIKHDIKLILNKVDLLNKKIDKLEKKVELLDKKVKINSIKIEILQKQMDKRFEDAVSFLWIISVAFLVLAGVTYRLCNVK